MSAVGKNLERFRIGVSAHDRINPDHNSWGIGLTHFDMERLDFDEGEELWPGITIHASQLPTTGNFVVLCDGQHDEVAAKEAVEADSLTAARA